MYATTEGGGERGRGGCLGLQKGLNICMQLRRGGCLGLQKGLNHYVSEPNMEQLNLPFHWSNIIVHCSFAVQYLPTSLARVSVYT